MLGVVTPKCREGFSNMKYGTVPGTMVLTSSLSPDKNVILPVRCQGSLTERMSLIVLWSFQK